MKRIRSSSRHAEVAKPHSRATLDSGITSVRDLEGVRDSERARPMHRAEARRRPGI